jgi:hypothetical protein
MGYEVKTGYFRGNLRPELRFAQPWALKRVPTGSEAQRKKAGLENG